MNVQVSIIIVNYNSCRLLLNCIDSILEHTRDVTFEIIVLDNDSKDGSKEIIEERYRECISFIQLKENVGYGRANNAGVRYAKGRYLLFLNPDTEFMNNVAGILAEYLEKNPEVAMAGPNLYDGELKPAYSFRRFFPSVFWELNQFLSNMPEKIRYGRNTTFNHTGLALEVGYLTGACLMVSKDRFESAGMFDPRYFMYFEETDLALCIRRGGWKIVNVPDGKAKHLEGGSFNPGPDRMKIYLASRNIYYGKNMGRIAFVASNVIFITGVTVRLLILSFAKRWSHRRDYYLGLKKVFTDLRRI